MLLASITAVCLDRKRASFVSNKIDEQFKLDKNRGKPGEGNGTPLQYSCLENPMDGGAWWAAVGQVLIQRLTGAGNVADS